MALPSTHVELLIDDVWQNITADLKDDPTVVIKRGRRDEASHADPSTATFHLRNRSGRYSPRNPLSDLYGKIGRNTPVRVREGAHNASLVLPGREEGYAWTPDAAALDITGDIDIRLDVEPTSWRPPTPNDMALARKYMTLGDQRSWAWWLYQNGTLGFRWSPDGTLGSALTKASTAAVPVGSGRLAVRVTLDVDSGGNHVIRFWTSPTLAADDWTELGSAQLVGGTTSIHAGTADLEVGRTNAASPNGGIDIDPFEGRIYAFELRDGIDGTVVTRRSWEVEESQLASWDSAIWDTSVWVDQWYEDWELGALAAVLDESVRFAGEISEWPSRWNLADTDVWVPVQASGILRRLRQGQRPVDSSMYRGITTTDSVVAYWPMEEAAGDRFASGLGDGSSGRVSAGAVDLAEYDDLPASRPLPTFEDFAVATFTAPLYDSPGIHHRAFFYADIDALPSSPWISLFEMQTTGSIRRWIVDLFDDGSLALKALTDDSPPVEVLNTGPVAFDVLKKRQLYALWLHQVGADINWQLATFELGDDFALTDSGTLNGHTFERATKFLVGMTDGKASVGHMTLLNGDTVDDVNAQLWAVADDLMTAWSGETAGDRIERISAEQGLVLRQVGHSFDTAAMGPAPISTAIEVLEDAAEVDLGFFGEDPHRLGLLYRTRHTMYSQDPVLVLDYEAGTVAEPIRPTDDDQGLVNDLTVERVAGGAYRLEQTTGPLSTQQPPAGVGIYDARVRLNVAQADQLPDQTSWRLHLGTVDELRIPDLQLILVNVRLAEHWPAISRMIEGDRIRIDNPPAWLPPQPLDLIVQGWTETLAVNWRDIRFVCTPAKPWEIGILEDDVLGRLDTSGSSVRPGTALSAGATTFNVHLDDPADEWTTDPAEFPFDVRVNGEIMTVTSISAVSSGVQSFTVTRGTNGIATEHDGGSALELAYPAIIGL